LRSARLIPALVVVLSIYALLNYYIARRGAQALAAYPSARGVFLAAFIGLALAYPLGRILMALASGLLSSVLVKAGSVHLALMLYGCLAVVLIDIVRLANAFVPFFPKALTGRPGPTGLLLFLAAGGTVLLAVAAGAVHAGRLRTAEIELRIGKKAGVRDGLTVVLASDFHLGAIVGKSRLAKVVSRINALEPDIVLLAGDIVDESVSEQEEAEYGRIMAGLRAPLGVYAVPGNHETFAGLDKALACLRSCGIAVLEDEAVKVADSFIVVGRRDRTSLKPGGGTRAAIGAILAKHGLDTRLPVILLDHQPVALEEAAEAGVDLQLSGHTHDGQIFPVGLINRWVFELNRGHLRKGDTHYYVTSGAGTWGPPVRTGSTAEVVRIRLTFAGGGGEGRTP
jgi:predicted MPP superfamily phosphohydrolase